jgi:hypothetical protein
MHNEPNAFEIVNTTAADSSVAYISTTHPNVVPELSLFAASFASSFL